MGVLVVLIHLRRNALARDLYVLVFAPSDHHGAHRVDCAHGQRLDLLKSHLLSILVWENLALSFC